MRKINKTCIAENCRWDETLPAGAGLHLRDGNGGTNISLAYTVCAPFFPFPSLTFLYYYFLFPILDLKKKPVASQMSGLAPLDTGSIPCF